MRLSLGGSAEGAPEVDLIRELSKAPRQLWLRIIELCAEGEIRLRQQVDARLVVELCMLKATAEVVAPAAVETKVQPVAPKAVVAQAQIESKTPVVAEPPVVATEVAHVQDTKPQAAKNEAWQLKWTSLIDAINKRDPMLSGVLRGFESGETEGGSLRITTKHKFHYDKVNDPAKIAVIAEVANEQFGYDLPVEIIFLEKAPAPKATGEEVNPTEAVLNTFKGSKIVGTHLHDINDDSTRRN